MTARSVRTYAVFFAIFVVMWLAMSAVLGDPVAGNVVPAVVGGLIATAVVGWQTERRRPGRQVSRES